MINILLLGINGSGKGTQAKKLAELLNYHVIGMGDLLREHKEKNTEIGKLATKLDKDGQLMPNSIIIDILREEFNKYKNSVNGFIFDGVVRTREQAKELDLLMFEFNHILIPISLEFNDRETLTNRLLKRGETSNRIEDSNIEVINKRFDVFDKNIESIKDYYNSVTDELVIIDANNDIDYVTYEILSIFNDFDTKEYPELYYNVANFLMNFHYCTDIIKHNLNGTFKQQFHMDYYKTVQQKDLF